ncbi:MAG: ABC transporter permease [Candidatus Acidiferrales bacterium]
MIPANTWMEAFRALGAHKLRSFLSTLGVTIGTACVVLVVTVSLTARQYLVGLVESIGSNLVYAEMVKTGGPIPLDDELDPADAQAIRDNIPEVSQVAGSTHIPTTIDVSSQVYSASLVGVTEDFGKIRHLQILRGRYLDRDEFDSRSKVCLLTEELAGEAFPADDPIGKSIQAGDLTFTVVGVFREVGSTLGLTEIQRNTILVPFSLMSYYTGNDKFLTLYAQAGRPEDVPYVTRRVAEILQSRHRPGAAYRVENLTSLLDVVQSISLAMSFSLLAVAFICMTVGGVNIMNIMLVTVKERTHEIGVRRAVGALREDIRRQFLLEALLISGTGALAGILAGIAVPVIVRPLLPENLSVPFSWLSVVVAFAVSCVIGVSFGYLPAKRAAALEPTECLRYE